MARIFTAFNEYEPDDTPSDGTLIWNGDGSYTKKYNHLNKRSYLDVNGGVGGSPSISALTLGPNVGDDLNKSFVAALILPSTVDCPCIGWSLGGSTGSENGIYIKLLPSTNQFQVRELNAGVDTASSLILGSAPDDIVYPNCPFWIAFSYDTSSLYLFWWFDNQDFSDAYYTLYNGVLGDHENDSPCGFIISSLSDSYSILYYGVSDEASFVFKDRSVSTLDEFEFKHEIRSTIFNLSDNSEPISAFQHVTLRDPDTDTDALEYYGLRPYPYGLLDDGSNPIAGGLKAPTQTGNVIVGDKYLDKLSGGSPEIEISNKPIDDVRPLSDWRNQLFDGLESRLYLGDANLPPRLYTPYASFVQVGQPNIDTQSNKAIIKLADSLDNKLNQPYPTPKFFGQRTCIEYLIQNTGKITASYVSSYKLQSFTVFGKIKVGVLDTGFATSNWIINRASGSEVNYRILCHVSSDTFRAYYTYSSAGGAKTLTGTSTVDDGEFHDVVFSVLPGFHAYLMVDGVIEDEISGSSVETPDTPSAGDLIMGYLAGVGTQILHCGVIDGYRSPNQMRSLLSTRLSGSEAGLLSLHRCDDESGSTVTDYGSLGNDATVGDVENTNWQYSPSLLGDLELSGQYYPNVFGYARQTLAKRIDVLREIFMINQSETLNVDELLRSQGVEVSPTTNADGVAEFSSSQSTPMTADAINESSATEDNDTCLLTEISERIVGATSIDLGNYQELQQQAPLQAGLAYDKEFKYSDMIKGLLTEAGFHYSPDPYGRIIFDFLTPPVSPGPVEIGCVETYADSDNIATLSGASKGPIYISNGESISSGDITICGWHKLQAFSESRFEFGSLRYPNSFVYTADNIYYGFATCKDWFPGADAGKFIVGKGGSAVQVELVVPFNEWFFVAIAMDSTGTFNFYFKTIDSDLVLVQSSTVATANASDPSIYIGGVKGGYQRISVFDGVQSQATLEAWSEQSIDGTETDLVVHAPLSELNSDLYTTELVSGLPFFLNKSKWAPQVELDVKSSRAKFEDGPRILRKAKAIEVLYDRAWYQYKDSELDAAVGEDERSQFTNRNKSAPYGIDEVSEDAFKIIYDSVLIGSRYDGSGNLIINNEGPLELLKLLIARFGSNSVYCKMSNLDRRFLSVRVMDEIYIINENDDAFPRSMRVAEIKISEWTAAGPKFEATLIG